MKADKLFNRFPFWLPFFHNAGTRLHRGNPHERIRAVAGVIHNLSENNYTFSANAPVIEGRFVLRFTNIINKFTTEKVNEVNLKVTANEIQINSLIKKIQTVYIYDIYTPSISGLLLAKREDINDNSTLFTVDEKYKLLNIKIILEDGSIINKKIMR